MVIIFRSFLKDFQWTSKFDRFAFLYARFLLRIYCLRLEDIQGGSKGLIRTCLLGMHSEAIEFIAVFIFLAYISISLFCNDPQSTEEIVFVLLYYIMDNFEVHIIICGLYSSFRHYLHFVSNFCIYLEYS